MDRFTTVNEGGKTTPGDRIRKRRVGELQPASWRYAVRHVVKSLRKDFGQILCSAASLRVMCVLLQVSTEFGVSRLLLLG
jgi:hypothetical protein